MPHDATKTTYQPQLKFQLTSAQAKRLEHGMLGLGESWAAIKTPPMHPGAFASNTHPH